MNHQDRQGKFFLASPWIRDVLGAIKKELKTEHLPGNRSFHQAHFANRPLQRITLEELMAVYERELLHGDEALGEWVTHRWVCKHGDVYQHFAERLTEISENFSQLQALSEEESRRVLAGASERFGPVTTYLFSLLNGVVFPTTIMETLRQEASLYKQQEAHAEEERIDEKNRQSLQEQHERQLRRLQEKYEGKLSGLEKKYQLDTDALKQQIRSLQRRLAGCP